MPKSHWLPAPDRPPLAPDAVDVWRADLADAAAHGDLHALLSADECKRAARFVRPDDGRRWAAARGILRELLGRVTGEDPRVLRFAEGPHGKPVLAGAGSIHFNLSHSGEIALYALALGRDVGVDVELPRRAVDHVTIARRVLGDREADHLATLDPAHREREFLRGWVRWEAVLKCRGTGIGAADAPAAGPDPWVHDLDVDPPAAAAVAVDGGPCQVRCWQWSAAAR